MLKNFAATALAALALSFSITACTAPTDAESVVGSSEEALVTAIPIVRAAQPVTGEHFYTVSYPEAVNAGFRVEAAPYFFLAPNDQGVGLTPFYRCFIPSAGKHFYTQAVNCEGAPAFNEGALGFVANGPTCGATPLYRMYNPGNGDHLYTTSLDEVRTAGFLGYGLEGTAGWVWNGVVAC
jgi:hypothetical protein